ncbi:hypothetical protein [Maribacter sp. IgM3_T14_3]|uniref:hypothetical protein n=1 Tax=Maribacter sp. IgM3_T14_3 TaxID=3415140 RepID=UPI003C6FD9EF
MPIKARTKFVLLLIATMTFCVSCSKDENDDDEVNSADVAASADEYVRSGTLLTTAESQLDGDITFKFISVSVNDALILRETSGKLEVANPFAFDYETNTMITGEIEASNGTESEVLSLQIDVNDIDDIGYFLKTPESKAAYEAASLGEWIQIQEDEYKTLRSTITEVSLVGSNDNQYDESIQYAQNNDSYVYDNATVVNEGNGIPQNNFVFAFKYYSERNNVAQSKVKVSAAELTEGHEDIGSNLPIHNTGEHFFVLKGNDISSENGYLSMYTEKGLVTGIRGNGIHFFISGDAKDIGRNFNASGEICIYQGLSTPIKQWD